MVRTVTDDDVGLKVLYEPCEGEGEPTIDIVAVHGIGAHPDDTWCKGVGADKNGESRYVNWLKDAEMLPAAIKDARIMRYGYQSQWFGKDALEQNASRIAPSLLDALKRKRKKSLERPLIFIAHSFGGLIILRTIQIAYLDQKQWPHVFSSIIGVIFFGTPFRGSKALHPQKMLEAALKHHESYEVQPEILQGLEPGTEYLKGLVEDFLRVWRSQKARIKILCFYEQRSSPISDIVGGGPKRIEIAVTEDEGCLDSSTEEIARRALSRSHFNMNKFAKPTEHDFETMCDFLDSWKTDAEEMLHARHRDSELPIKSFERTEEQKASLQSLYFPEMNSRKNDISDPANKTCTWLFEHSTYRKWLDQQQGLLWIKGKPGAGKSTIMRHAFASMEKQAKHIKLILASFFFHGRGVKIQKTVLGLFRSLLHQILQQIPESLQTFSLLFKNRCEVEGNFGEKWDWQERDLQDFFKTHITEAAVAHRIQIYVDALDECGEKAARDIVRFFELTTAKSAFTKAFLGICFSCRDYPHVALENGLEIRVEDENHDDIGNYIKANIHNIIQHHDTAETILNEVMKKAYGSFQWTLLVIGKVIDLYNEGKSRRLLLKHVQGIPSELNYLYQKLLEDIDDETLPETLQLMQWICFALRPLSLTELRFAIIVGADSPWRSFRQCQEAEEFTETDEQMEKKVRFLSRGLAEVKQHEGRQVVQFNHQSVKEYLLQHGLQILDKYANRDIVGRAHFRLSRSCIRYIAMDELSHLDLENTYSFTPKLDNFPFLHYAVTSWIPHVQRVEEEKLPQQDLIDFFYRPSTKLMKLWANFHGILNSDSDGFPFEDDYLGTTLLHVAAMHKLLSVLLAIPYSNHVDVNTKDAKGQTPLHCAASRGHKEVTKILVNRNDINVNSKNIKGESPLFIAAYNGKNAIVHLLLDHNGIDVNSKNIYGESPLSIAAYNGDNETVNLLLNQKGIDVNSKGRDERTPLFVAIGRGHETVVELLLNRKDVDVNSHDTHYCTPLSEAIHRENTAMIKLLLNRDDIDVNYRSSDGWRPLSLAIEIGNTAVIKLLLNRNDIDVNFKFSDNWTLLSWAAHEGREALVNLLLSRADIDVNIKDNSGRTAYDLAVEYGHVEVARLLQPAKRSRPSSHSIDVNSSLGK